MQDVIVRPLAVVAGHEKYKYGLVAGSRQEKSGEFPHFSEQAAFQLDRVESADGATALRVEGDVE